MSTWAALFAAGGSRRALVQEAAERKQLAEADAQTEQAMKHREDIQAEITAAAKRQTDDKDAFERRLAALGSEDGADSNEVIADFLNTLQATVAASSAYIGVVEPAPAGAEGDDGEPARILRYTAATRDKFLLAQPLKEGQGPVTFSLFKTEEEQAEEEADDDAAGDEELTEQQKAQRAEAKAQAREQKRLEKLLAPKFVNVPNVVVGPTARKLHFFRVPKLGAYFAIRLQYETTLTEDVIRKAGQWRQAVRTRAACSMDDARACSREVRHTRASPRACGRGRARRGRRRGGRRGEAQGGGEEGARGGSARARAQPGGKAVQAAAQAAGGPAAAPAADGALPRHSRAAAAFQRAAGTVVAGACCRRCLTVVCPAQEKDILRFARALQLALIRIDRRALLTEVELRVDASKQLTAAKAQLGNEAEAKPSEFLPMTAPAHPV
jgi:hypothetical protein